MDIRTIPAVYFVGAGGIGMSALMRYFLAKGKQVAGYDKTPSELTEQLARPSERLSDFARNRRRRLVIRWGKATQRLKPGDVVVIHQGVKHWHRSQRMAHAHRHYQRGNRMV